VKTIEMIAVARLAAKAELLPPTSEGAARKQGLREELYRVVTVTVNGKQRKCRSSKRS